MYDLPGLHDAHDRLWRNIRARLETGPDTYPPALDRDTDAWEAWQSPRLLLAQTCGLPYRARLHARVTLVGAPDHRLPGCPPGHYRSVIVARTDDPRDDLPAFADAVFAYNEGLSQSGWAAPAAHFSDRGIPMPRQLCRTGGHAASARAVAEGRADLAALDAVTWEILRDTRAPGIAALRVLAQTAATPALPYITAAGTDPEPLFDALAGAIADLDRADRDALHLHGVVRLPASAYLALPLPPGPSPTY
ncbi:phosphate/phosphite/phosphonate ABC transporter substrate-binding protein [Pukyongiella litopenaei]|uniref:Phosphate/phosphite/phosphonate ABC transporter substrate-binding protein n=2 Tax=Pukyongiella litopenaei TaxID=2605946 RepID=A0A2S0MT77_9RHOB|nr:phosphate/phosphite/phosphonate ABC transporter substrate-binding protein [Pukyongiella litopenaei]